MVRHNDLYIPKHGRNFELNWKDLNSIHSLAIIFSRFSHLSHRNKMLDSRIKWRILEFFVIVAMKYKKKSKNIMMPHGIMMVVVV